jgi:hypothetical protein
MSTPKMDRVYELSKMSRAALEAEEARVMREKGMRRIWQAGRMSKDELVSSILRIEGDHVEA